MVNVQFIASGEVLETNLHNVNNSVHELHELYIETNYRNNS